MISAIWVWLNILKHITNVNVDSEHMMISPWDGKIIAYFPRSPYGEQHLSGAMGNLYNWGTNEHTHFFETVQYNKGSDTTNIFILTPQRKITQFMPVTLAPLAPCPKILSKSSVSCLTILFSSLKLLPILENVHKTNRTLADWSIPRLVQ